MKISYNWLKNYLSELPEPRECEQILTDIGLEVEGMEKTESIKGGLEGVVIAKVMSCKKHPNADKLSITTVDTGSEILPIVCGAPNVATGQKVAVATVGTTLYMDDDSLTLKKVKIRGEVSEGMICAEDELGLGNNHDGIMVLDADAEIGTPAREYFNVESDVVFEIGLTPNRIDGASHYGVARDLAAFLRQEKDVALIRPEVDKFAIDNHDLDISVTVENPEACTRYSGLTLTGINIKESPDWLQNSLKAIGLKPINNIVDITNFVLHETGQPLHAFDADMVKGNKVIVKTLPGGSKFTTLDEMERELHEDDLMICNEKEGMCIAGVFGGIKSGVSDTTTSVFLESACFNPVYVRKTAKRHVLNTDSSFRFERGADPNLTIYALKRAALLMKELADAKISSEIVDVYPEPVSNYQVTLTYDYLYTLMGKIIEKEKVRNILGNLDILIENETEEALFLSVPPYRADVQRPADVVEEILRIYGYNNVEFPHGVRSNLTHQIKPDAEKVNQLFADYLSNNGFNEIMSNSLTKNGYYEEEDQRDPELVKIYNPLSSDLNCMRKTLLFGGLETIAYNRNRKYKDLKIYEYGNIYRINPKVQSDNPHRKYFEEPRLGLFISGKTLPENWNGEQKTSDFYHLKSYVEQILQKIRLKAEVLGQKEISDFPFSQGLTYSLKGKPIVEFGKIDPSLLKSFEIEEDVFYADFHWNQIIKQLKNYKTTFVPITKYPEVRRDLSMILDKDIAFEDLRQTALKTEKKLLREVSIFDVYEGDKIEKGKKSYALSFILQDEHKTLTDKQIDKVMKNISSQLEKNFTLKIRS